jgi:hypothetical protein
MSVSVDPTQGVRAHPPSPRSVVWNRRECVEVAARLPRDRGSGTEAPTTTEAPTATAAPTTTEPRPAPLIFDGVRERRGPGRKVTDARIVAMGNPGRGYFGVTTFTKDLSEGDRIVNGIAPNAGTYLPDLEDGSAVETRCCCTTRTAVFSTTAPQRRATSEWSSLATRASYSATR